MKKLKLLSLATAMAGLGFVALTNSNPTTAHASAYKQIASKDYSANPPAYKVKVPGKTAYMWTKNHGRKIHNLKNYPRTTWYVQKSVKFRHNGKNNIYWQVQNASGKVKGLVWRQYFKPGGVKKANTGKKPATTTVPTTFTKETDSLPLLGRFTSSAEYLTFLQNAPIQRAARLILSKFPKAQLDLNLSRYAQAKAVAYSEDAAHWFGPRVYDASQLTGKITELVETENLIYYKPKEKQRIEGIDEALEADGYSKAIRENYTGKIGLFIVDGIAGTEGSYFRAYGIQFME